MLDWCHTSNSGYHCYLMAGWSLILHPFITNVKECMHSNSYGGDILVYYIPELLL